MPKSAPDFVNDLWGHLKNIEKTRSKTERLYQEGSLVRRDLERVYAGLYVDAITFFENFIEDLFVRLLVGTAIHPSRLVVPKITFKSHDTCRNIVYGGGAYVDWFPYNLTQRRARVFFRNGLPFTGLDSSDKKNIDRMLRIRNAITHKSKHARKKFDQEVTNGLLLLPHEKTPAGYLRSNYAISPPQTQYELIRNNIVAIARELSTLKHYSQ